MTENVAFPGARLDDADLSGAHLHSPNLTGLKITDGFLENADISGYIGGLRINGVEVAPLVEAELTRLHPERVLLKASDPKALAEAWEMLEGIWVETLARARELPTEKLSERVDGEWSFLETLRHLIMATDCWLGRMILQEAIPFHEWGMAGSFLADPTSIGLDYAARPTLDELLVVRRGRMDAVAATIAGATPEALAQVCEPPDTEHHPDHPASMLQCLQVILDEEWMHCQYAKRDLAILEGAA